MSLTTLIAKLKEVYPTAERDAFAFSAIDSSLSIRVEGTDVHNSLRSKGSNEKSNKDQIDLTYGASHPTGTSPVHDFFPTIDLPEHLPQSRHLKISCKIWGECLAEKKQEWVVDEIDVVRFDRNEGRNPGLQLRGIKALRRSIPEGQWLVFVHRVGQTSYEVFSLQGDQWANPSKRSKEVLFGGKGVTRIYFQLEQITQPKDMPGNNTIFFGPPGTGKSTAVKRRVASAQSFRTQFHPEYSHADFIGTYRPVVGSENDTTPQVLGHDGSLIKRPINYFAFVPGPLTDALEHAFDSDDHVYFVIEEINRGDCAAIFGDVFQLLDRDDTGRSEFGITPRPELIAYFNGKGVKYDMGGDGKLYLPQNLSLLATMNTSDQSLYPMDAAFKRRWQWEACQIDFTELIKYTGGIRPFLDDGKGRWDWIALIERLNKIIVRDQMEDKQLGPWFIKPGKDGLVPFESFLNKALFYLWHDVFKEEQLSDRSPFKSDGPDVFGEAQANIRRNGLAAGMESELLLASALDVKAASTENQPPTGV